jgi:tRNA(fMet)-specific endonuclease VapC
MIRYLLDTDHLTLHEQGHAPLRQRLAAHPPVTLAVSAWTVEESLRGRLAVLARNPTGTARVRAYAKLIETVRFFAVINIAAFDEVAEERYENLRSQRLGWEPRT